MKPDYAQTLEIKKVINRILIFCSILFFLSITAFAQKQISITIDDPTTKDTPLLNWQEKDSLILKTLEKNDIRVALFVCGKRIDDKNGKILLNNWDSKKHLICNHSYSHLYFNSKSVSSDIFIADFKKCDSLIRTFKNFTQLFRFPYLKEGNSVEKRDSVRAELKKKNYKNGYVTIDASDWYIDSQLSLELNRNINADLTPYKEYYIKHIVDRTNYYDSLAKLVFKREIKHTLLIHHSLLNALFLDDLLIVLKAYGWNLIDAKDAYENEIFPEQPNTEPFGEGIVWQFANETESISKTLRYPAEDGEYEKEALKQYLNYYRTKTKNK